MNTIETEANERKQLLSFLNEEISQIQKEESRPGWTIWALVGGIATCAWLLINQIENLIPDWNVVGMMMITMTIVSLALKGALKNLQKKSSGLMEDRFRPVRHMFENSKPTTILILSWFTTIYFLLNKLDIHINNWTFQLTKYSFAGFAIFLSFGFIFLLTGDLFVLPTSIEEGKIKNKKLSLLAIILQLLTLGLLILLSISWINYIYISNLFIIYEFKISALIYTILILILLLTSLKSPSYTLDNLLELRREVVLGVLPAENIKYQMDFILRGMKMEDYYNKELSQTLLALQQFEKEIYLSTQKVNLFLDKIKDENSSQLENSLTIDALESSVNSHLTNAAQLMFSQLEISTKKLARKKTVMKVLNSKIDNHWANDINAAMNKSRSDYNHLIKNWHEVLKSEKGQESSEKMIDSLMKKFPKLTFDRKTGVLL